MDLSTIIVTHNSGKYILPCLNSIGRASHSLKFEIFIIDNKSTDETKKLIQPFGDSISLIELPENQGFARAVNIGLRKSSGEFRLVINPDVIIRSGSLVPMIEFMRNHPMLGISGCKLLNPDGTLQFSKGTFPTVWSTFLRAVLPRRMRKYQLWGYEKVGQCDWVTGAFMLIRNGIIEETGYLDEEYFLYYEDVDYCLQAATKGWQTFYYPEIIAYHLNPNTLIRKNDRIQKEIRRSRLHFFKKNGFNGSYRSLLVLMKIMDYVNQGLRS